MNHPHRGKNRKVAQQLCSEEIFSFFEDQNTGQDRCMEEDEEEEEEHSQFYSGDTLFGVLVEMFPHKSRQSLLEAWNTHRPNLEGAITQLLSEPDSVCVTQGIVNINELNEATTISSSQMEDDYFDEWSGLTPPERSFRDDWSTSPWNVDMIRNSKYNHNDHSSIFQHLGHTQSTFPS
eukprot:c11452_g1_i1.p1 GENE.c11452_g1_i1~~c11452_g1_i1.p1  ORF type:complete len:178 (+),score=62.15 c11452_g1_i1:347-880(+)